MPEFHPRATRRYEKHMEGFRTIKEEIKLLLFLNDIIAYTENPRNYTLIIRNIRGFSNQATNTNS